MIRGIGRSKFRSPNDRANRRPKRAQPGSVAVGCPVDVVTYLPQVGGNTDVTPAREFVSLWMQALGERANDMREDARLTLCADQHASYLAQRQGEAIQVSMHIGQNNSSPDQRVRACGYSIPAHWHSNHVESCATHTGGPLAALDMLLASPGHRAHLLGEGGFAGSTVFGVGNAKSYYTILICPEEL